jgi:glycogen synthase
VSSPVKLLVVTAWYPPHHFGGYELCCFDVMQRLEQRGFEVHVLCSDYRLRGVADATTEHESRVRRELAMYVKDDVIVVPNLRGRVRWERANQSALARALDEVQPDILSPWQMSALSTGLLARMRQTELPLVYGIHDDWLTYLTVLDQWAKPFAGPGWRRALGRVAGRLTGLPTGPPDDLGDTGAFLFNSALQKQRSEEMSPWRFPLSAVVYPGIDRSVFGSSPLTPSRPFGWKLVYSGRFDPRKGVETLVRALALLPEATVEAFGLGGEAERVRLAGIARELGVESRISFGSTTRTGLAAAYAEADCVVFPSNWEEPFGLVPVEAMACGVPVVATAAGGSKEFLVDGWNCVTFDRGKPSALAGAVRRLAADAGLRDRLVEGGRRTAVQLDIDICAREYEAWYRAALDGFAHPPPQRTLDLGPDG